MTTDNPDFKAWLDRVKGKLDAERVAQDLGLDRPRPKGRFFCPACQPDGGRTPDLMTKGDCWKCFKCGQFGDVIALAMMARGADFMAVANWR